MIKMVQQVFGLLCLQVFDLGEEAPDKVLHQLYGNIEKLKSEGDHLAAHIEKTLRLIVSEMLQNDSNQDCQIFLGLFKICNFVFFQI